MIQQLSIKNFKSIKDISFGCKKVNVLIGEPNSGKSNIIEALCLQSMSLVDQQKLNPALFRYSNIGELFYDFNINDPIRVQANEIETGLTYPADENKYLSNKFIFKYDLRIENSSELEIEHSGKIIGQMNFSETSIKYYEFKKVKGFERGYQSFLAVPYGDNLPTLLLSNERYKTWVRDFLKEKGFILTLKPAENEINISKLVDGNLYSYPYFAVSETLQRVIFYVMALETNKSSTLLFDEPETNTFPFYTKYLAERIALDETNQFFLTTHNPYLLLSLIEKTKQEDINVCLVSMKDYQTRVTVLDAEQVSKVLDFNADVFFNFDKIIG